MFNRIIAISIVAILMLSLFSGCTNHKQAKEDAQQAINKQIEIKNYHFSGSADLKLGTNATTTYPNPMTGLLMAMFTNSTVSWDGVASVDPVQLEVRFQITMTGTNQTLDMPILLKDNKLYVHIPLLSEPDQFFLIDLDELSAQSNQENPFTSSGLQNSGQLAALLFSQLTESIDVKAFTKKKQTITAEITTNNADTFVKTFITQLPQLINQLQSGGFISEAQRDKYITDLDSQAQRYRESFALSDNKPGRIVLELDKQGYVKKQEIDLAFSIQDKSGQPEHYAIQFTNNIDEINNNPKFTQEIPQDVLPLDQILEQLQTQAEAPENSDVTE